MTLGALVLGLALWLAATERAAADAYTGLVPVAGESHQHAATLYLLERWKRDPPVPGFGLQLHENGAAAVAWDTMRAGGYDWGSLSFHDTNYPGRLANVCLDASSEKYRWWQGHVSANGFPGADPPWNESSALARLATQKTVEGDGGFLAFSGREFTSVADTPKGVGPREGGHKIVILPGESSSMCGGDRTLLGDEYCSDEYHLFRWMAGDPRGQGVVIQAHPGLATEMDLRPLHPKNAPAGFSDAFVQGVEVSSAMQDPQYEANYQRMLALGYRVFPAFGSDSHSAIWPGNEASARKSATVCWVEARTRRALIRAMHERRCYYTTAWRPELRFSARAGPASPWVAMGGLVDAPNGQIEVRVDAVNDPRNFNPDPRRGKRFDVVELLDANGRVLTSQRCTRATDGRDTCTLALPRVAVRSGAVYPRIRMLEPSPEGCRSKDTPKLLPNCGKVVIGGAIYVNWPAFVAQGAYRPCRFGAADPPCGVAGCLPPALDRDQDGYPNGCDVCPDQTDPQQPDANKDGFGDVCGRPQVQPPGMINSP